MRRLSLLSAVSALAVLVLNAPAVSAQAKPAAPQNFGMGYTDVGPTIGLGGLGSASAAFGGRFEHAIKTLPDLANGVLGIQAGVDYYSWSSGAIGGYSWSYKYIPVGVTANYHFVLEDKRFDPFVGLGLGYNVVSCSWSGPTIGSNDCGYSSGIYFIGKAGARYFFNPKMAFYGDVGAGAATLNLGLMFRLM
jgi:outer membrane protein W